MSLRPNIRNLPIYFYPTHLFLFDIIIIFISYLLEEEDIYVPEESKPNLSATAGTALSGKETPDDGEVADALKGKNKSF